MSRRGGLRKRLTGENDEEYALRRQKNNDAVNRTRQKKRMEERDLVERVEELRKENVKLENEVEALKKELDFLKEMFGIYAKANRNKKSDDEKNSAKDMEQEVAQFSKAVDECLKASNEALEVIEDLAKDIKNYSGREYIIFKFAHLNDFHFEGISLLEVKNHDHLAYLCNMAYLMGQMSRAKSIQGDEAIDRLIYLRIILERIRPIDQKMRSQIEKLFSRSRTNEQRKILRPHPELMKVDDVGKESSDENNDSDNEPSSAKKYVPPKLVPVHYNEDEEAENEKKIERARKRALQSSLIQDLRAEYTDAPEVIMEDQRPQKRRQNDDEKQKYEEDYFIRLQVSKKEKHKRRLENRQNLLDDLLHFGDYMALDAKDKPSQNLAKSRKNSKKLKKVGSKSHKSSTRHIKKKLKIKSGRIKKSYK
ncbi:unnamed protein product [Dracunculus medinensis]|uniref:BZIP domain-containing protein n=1 Tax=Dracunculus medinensis TaxID=318479 RepID=A0A0N4U7C4_DRAME|nr:unnamed protein product [Dracunculus medinensis]